MPRTKHSRNQKRNREIANEELIAGRLREFDAIVDQYLCGHEMRYQQNVENLSGEIYMLMRRLPENLLKMKIGELKNLNIRTIEEFNQITKESSSSAVSSSQMLGLTILQKSARKTSKDDEGYLTEDTARTSSSTQSKRVGRLPLMGPLSSAKAKSRRRSQSVCGYLNIVKGVGTVQRASRSQMRTPFNNRAKGASASAGRAEPVTPKVAPNTPLSLLRYANAGETVISLSGSPVVAQGMQDQIANVNIPVKNGVISLRPTKMQSIDADILTRIDSDTLNQIKQLQSNLNMIMSYADKAFS